LAVLAASLLEAQDVHESRFAVLEGNEIPKAPNLNYTEDVA